jgi:hypothetical protein
MIPLGLTTTLIWLNFEGLFFLSPSTMNQTIPKLAIKNKK